MADNDDRLEERLRTHLARVTELPPPPSLIAKATAPATEARTPRSQWWTLMGVVLAVAVAVTLLLLVTTGQQTQNVFSNISNGLNA